MTIRQKLALVLAAALLGILGSAVWNHGDCWMWWGKPDVPWAKPARCIS